MSESVTTKRLSAAMLDTAEMRGGRTQRFTRTNHCRSGRPTIVHIGVGAFARAHLAVYADDLLQRGVPAMIAGVSLRSGTTEEQLAPQDCLFTLTERGPHSEPLPRVITSIASVATGPDAAVQAIVSAAKAADTAKATSAAKATDSWSALVTLTVTEKGYEVPAADLESPSSASSAPGVIARALNECRLRQLSAPIIASLDNVAFNGHVLRTAVISVAERSDTQLADWIETSVNFPNSVVDRIVPSTTDDDRAQLAQTLGFYDDAAVIAEHHRSWAIERTPRLLPLDTVGVEIVDRIDDHQRRKLWLLNAPHSAIAYAGLYFGATTIAEAIADPRVRAFVEAVTTDLLQVAEIPPSLMPESFAAEALVRFGNASLGHTCAQVAADGSRKLAQRVFPAAAIRAQRGLPNDSLAAITALWLAAVSQLSVGRLTATTLAPLPTIDDPASRELAGLPISDLATAALGIHVGPSFITLVDRQLHRLVAGEAVLELLPEDRVAAITQLLDQ